MMATIASSPLSRAEDRDHQLLSSRTTPRRKPMRHHFNSENEPPISSPSLHSTTNKHPPRPPSGPSPLSSKNQQSAVAPPAACKKKLNWDSPLPQDPGVKVIIRIRPSNPKEKDVDTAQIALRISDNSLSMEDQHFTFDSVLGPEASQQTVFKIVGLPLVEHCLAGFNSSIFAYGQTGSGKTFTMWGLVHEPTAGGQVQNEDRGLIPRIFEQLFARIQEEEEKNREKQLQFHCQCSLLEIYNEQITDLLEPTQRNLQIREDAKAGVYVENLTEEVVSKTDDVTRLLLRGLANRRVGATSMNSESSRSHSVFTCTLESRWKSLADGISSVRISRMNLVDLAGSERQKLTGAAGERLKEAGNINRSLSQLGNLINILAEASQTGRQRHIPYRDSRLTFLLQESLGGNAKLAMICAVSPISSCKNESLSTLRFARRAKAIQNNAIINEKSEDNVNSLREQIRQLKDELMRMKSNELHPGVHCEYSTGWSASRSYDLLRKSLNNPMAMPSVNTDVDKVMGIEEDKAVCMDSGNQSTREDGSVRYNAMPSISGEEIINNLAFFREEESRERKIDLENKRKENKKMPVKKDDRECDSAEEASYIECLNLCTIFKHDGERKPENEILDFDKLPCFDEPILDTVEMEMTDAEMRMDWTMEASPTDAEPKSGVNILYRTTTISDDIFMELPQTTTPDNTSDSQWIEDSASLTILNEGIVESSNKFSGGISQMRQLKNMGYVKTPSFVNEEGIIHANVHSTHNGQHDYISYLDGSRASEMLSSTDGISPKVLALEQTIHPGFHLKDEDSCSFEEAVKQTNVKLNFNETSTLQSKLFRNRANKCAMGSDEILHTGINDADLKLVQQVDNVLSIDADSKLVQQVNNALSSNCAFNCETSIEKHLESSDVTGMHIEQAVEHINSVLESPILSVSPNLASPILQSPTLTAFPHLHGNRGIHQAAVVEDGTTLCDPFQPGNIHQRLDSAEHNCFPLETRSNMQSNTLCSTLCSSPVESLSASLQCGLQVINDQQKSSICTETSSIPLHVESPEVVKASQGLEEGTGTSLQMFETGDLCNISGGKASMEFFAQSVDKREWLGVALKESNTSMETGISTGQNTSLRQTVEAVLAGTLRREHALEEALNKKDAEIEQLNRLVWQYKHERDCNAILQRIREDKIARLESLMDGSIPTDAFLTEEWSSLLHEYKVLQEKFDHHPEVTVALIEQHRLQEKIEHYKSFFDLGERDALQGEIRQLRNQLQSYSCSNTPVSAKQIHLPITPRIRETDVDLTRKSINSLAHSDAQSPCKRYPPMVFENLPNQRWEEEKGHWIEREMELMSVLQELRTENEDNKQLVQKQQQEIECEKCSAGELRDALQIAMTGHARLLDQYAELQEKHICLLAKHRKIKEGIAEARRKAGKVGRKEKRVLEAQAAELAVIKIEREQEQQLAQEQIEELQAQLRDTADAVQAAGELLVRLKEAEELVLISQDAAARAEHDAATTLCEMEKLRRQYTIMCESVKLEKRRGDKNLSMWGADKNSSGIYWKGHVEGESATEVEGCVWDED